MKRIWNYSETKDLIPINGFKEVEWEATEAREGL